MANLEWNDSLLIGISEIDAQHKYFVELIQEYSNLIKTEDKEKRNEVLTNIINYARKHFDTEEGYFEKYNYPFAKEHAIEHMRLLKQVNKFYDDLFFDRVNPKEVVSFLSDWLENHLKKHDFKYRDYFRKNKLI